MNICGIYSIFGILKNNRFSACARVYNILPGNFYFSKVHNRDTKRKCEICSKLAIKSPERCQFQMSCCNYQNNFAKNYVARQTNRLKSNKKTFEKCVKSAERKQCCFYC